MAATRPKLSCDEDELLRMQEDFAAGRIGNSDTSEVIRAPQSKSTENSEGKKSIFAQRRGAAEKVKGNAVQFEFTKFQVLKDVVEKCEMPQPKLREHKRENAFPEVFQRKKSLKASGTGSIFSQQLKKAKMTEEDVKAELPTVTSTPAQFDHQCSMIAKSVLGETEANKIHQENVQKLSSMTQEDILREQHQLLSNLDPKLVTFLKQKKKAATISKAVEESPVIFKNQAESEQELEIGEIRELTNSTWVHMDKIEKEKVRWMSALPPIKDIPGASFQARFDFDGLLLPATADLPVTTALYHHGEEPERAGYSVNELMLLSRSSKLQQRVLALNTLAKVLENTRLGIFDSCFEAPLVPTLLDSGLLMLLRFSLDDNTPAVVAAALVAFSRLISSPFDETCLERCYGWHSGEVQPNLCSRVQMDSTDQEQEAEMKDNEIIQVDVIKACLRMDIFWRIRFILEEIRPEARAVVAALEILTRIARHSPFAAQSILDCPRLMESIFRFFLPKHWQAPPNRDQESVDNVYGLPVRQVLRLARVIASWNVELATKLVTKYSLLESIQIYVAMDTAEVELPTQEALLLVLDSYYTWRTLLRQDIGIESFLNFYPALFPQLLYYQSSVSMDGTATGSNVRFSHQLGSSMLLLMEAVLSACCCPGNRQHLHVIQVRGLREVVEMCVARWSMELRQLTNPIPESSGCLLAAGIHLLATFYEHWSDQQAPSLLDTLCIKHILPLLHSETMNELSKSLIRYSNLSSALQSSSRYPETLPSVNATTMGGELVPVLATSSPFPLLTSIFRLLRIWKNKCTSSEDKELKLSISYFDYLASLSQSPTTLSDNWFTRYEIRFLHQLLMICAKWCVLTNEQSKIVHQAALTAVTSISSGEESIAKDWIRSLIFQKEFVKRGCDLETNMEQLHLNDPSTKSLLTQALDDLDQVATFFSSQLFPVKLVESSLRMLTLENRQILPADWIYLPLVMLYQRELEKPSHTNQSVPETALLTLKAGYVLLSLQPTWFFRIQPTAHYARLACTFMAANDLFLEENVCGYMWPILRKLAGQQLDFSRPVAGVDDFIDFYDRLLDQFEAVSYGSPLFAAFVLLPIQQSQQVRFRMKLWCEHSNALRILTLNDQQLLDSMDHWLDPIETDEDLLMRYAASIRLQLITKPRNSVLFKIATHHLQQYVERNPHVRAKLNW